MGLRRAFLSHVLRVVFLLPSCQPSFLYTAISRKVVGKSARDNPQRYCGWFGVHCSSKKFERMSQDLCDVMFAITKGKQQK